MRWRGKVVIVTGGAGFIGSKLITRLAQRGATLIVIDDFSSGKRQNLQDVECKIVESNVVYINRLNLNKSDSPDFIFHLGAPSSDVLFRQNLTQCLLDTIKGFIEVLKYAEEHQVKKLIYATSSSVYGRTVTLQSEDLPPHPTNIYGVAKLICESIASSIPDVKSVGLRIFAGYGPGEEHKGEIASVVTLFLKQILKGQKPVVYGDGSQKRDFVYIDDIIDALVISAERDVKGIINVGTGQSHSFLEVLNLLMKQLGKHVAPIFVPKPKGYFDHTKAEVSKMEECLGIHPIDLQTGIERYLAQIHEHRYGWN